MTARLVPLDDVIVFPKLKAFTEIDGSALMADGHHVDASLSESRHRGIRRIESVGNENVAPIHRVEHSAEKAPLSGSLPFVRCEIEIDNCASGQRNHRHGAHDGKPYALLLRLHLRECELIFGRVWHRQSGAIDQEHFAVSPMPRIVCGIVDAAADLFRQPNHDRQRESSAGIAVAGGRRRASPQASCDAVRENARHRLIQRFVLTETLRKPSPQRHQRTEDSLAVFVTFELKRPQNVFARQNSTKWQAAVVRKFISDGAEVFARHFGSRSPHGANRIESCLSGLDSGDSPVSGSRPACVSALAGFFVRQSYCNAICVTIKAEPLTCNETCVTFRL